MAHTEKEILDYWMKKDSLGLNWTQEDRIIFAMREFANQSAQEHPTISKTERVQTAVEFLVSKLPLGVKGSILDEIEQAKQMFEKQIEKAWDDGFDTGYLSPNNANKYYNETYGK